jgi:hypothetical protein
LFENLPSFIVSGDIDCQKKTNEQMRTEGKEGNQRAKGIPEEVLQHTFSLHPIALCETNLKETDRQKNEKNAEKATRKSKSKPTKVRNLAMKVCRHQNVSCGDISMNHTLCM